MKKSALTLLLVVLASVSLSACFPYGPLWRDRGWHDSRYDRNDRHDRNDHQDRNDRNGHNDHHDRNDHPSDDYQRRRG